ncbi:hypothetical protein NEMBOFW57_002711 [Staphylotrichum longicolle]|uniref:Uncharacterized protein n=1 Tax=Staphylotrichum longicolle TaxID=669026 RepID=A0AAD4F4L4_9PEZI|nr:hypothetical protein NEMBOFW57_002711 [Staphylotrichum longicolle]
MAPAANTARQRRVPGSARTPADLDSDAEYQAYNGRLKEASAARTRLRKAQQTRDKNRTALATAYGASLLQIEARVQKAVAKHKDLRTALHISHLNRLKQALDRRDETVGRIARKLAEHQRRMLNLAIQLRALYEGRKEDVAGLLTKGGGGEAGEGELAGGISGGNGDGSGGSGWEGK